jgi:hypothetical protein
MFDSFVGRIAVAATKAFASSPNRGTLTRSSGIDDFIFLASALGTTHISAEPNGRHMRLLPDVAKISLTTKSCGVKIRF